ncbi:tetratricopeptide repeat protein, partial [Dolichospermum circinale]
HQLAGIYADTGKIEEAIAHYQQSLEIKESIGNVQGKAATLHQLAGIYANTGKIEEAIAQ